MKPTGRAPGTGPGDRQGRRPRSPCLAPCRGDGWAGRGFDATTIPPANQGLCYLIAEGGTPQLVKAAYLSDADITALADYAAWIRGKRSLTPASAALACPA